MQILFNYHLVGRVRLQCTYDHVHSTMWQLNAIKNKHMEKLHFINETKSTNFHDTQPSQHRQANTVCALAHCFAHTRTLTHQRTVGSTRALIRRMCMQANIH